ncbi:Annexin [Opisthorchis viverrini]|uniref:Annexin n=2 Tax=Opisthorchis viverrini TaxID=6198 RepID=A0A074Z7L5_OPIVI|nr:hypothetical protein T265_08893 [Opisthorchis viverrini]KER23161.1 hypothetical protein T265_08893 [Opisthorchis viverrini]OON14960.1 Annexin [Opisthorchis viverrini]
MSCRCYYVGPDGESYNPSLKAPKTFDVEKDCIALREAMKGMGTDENTIIDILGHRNTEQRLKIRDHYKTMYGKDLIEKLKGELTGNFERLVVMLLTDGPTIKAKALYDAMKGAGTKESVIIEILCTASNDEIAEIKQAYENLIFNCIAFLCSSIDSSLEQDVSSDLSGCFKHFVTALLQGKRDEVTDEQFERMKKEGVSSILDMAKVGQDVADIYDAGVGKLGTDESVFIRLLAGRSIWHLQAVSKAYEKTTGHSLMEAIDSETSGDFRDALMLTLCACILRLRAYSDLLACSMAGLGTNDSSLMRIIVTRCEIDLKDISLQFEADQGKSLAQWIKEDTSGDYCKLLLTLLGEE